MSRSRAYRRKQFPLPNDTDKKPYQTEIQKIRKKRNKKGKGNVPMTVANSSLKSPTVNII